MKREEFEKHIRQLRAPLRRFLLSKCDNAPVVDDLIQETLIMAWQRADTFEGNSALLTWVCKIGYHYLCKSESELPVTRSIDSSTLQIADPDDADAQMLRQALRKAIECLSPAERDAIQLYYDEDKDINQIAEIIEMPLSTVKSLLRRGRNKLRTLIETL